jgi:hypothetical protein
MLIRQPRLNSARELDFAPLKHALHKYNLSTNSVTPSSSSTTLKASSHAYISRLPPVSRPKLPPASPQPALQSLPHRTHPSYAPSPSSPPRLLHTHTLHPSHTHLNPPHDVIIHPHPTPRMARHNPRPRQRPRQAHSRAPQTSRRLEER